MESATFSPRAKSKKKLVCIVQGCESASNRDENIRFHYFPLKTNRFVCSKNLFGQTERRDQLKVWMKTLNIKEVNSGMKVCSLHFRKDDYILPHVPVRRRCLKTTAVPLLNLSHTKNTSKGRKARALQRNTQKNKIEENLIANKPIPSKEDTLLDNELVVSENSTDHNSDEVAADRVVEMTTEQHALANNCRRLVQNAEVQVETQFLEQNFIHFSGPGLPVADRQSLILAPIVQK